MHLISIEMRKKINDKVTGYMIVLRNLNFLNTVMAL